MKPRYLIVIALTLIPLSSSWAHRSGCHRWHSCPSDSGSYSCGDLGHPCRFGSIKSGSILYPPSSHNVSYPSTTLVNSTSAPANIGPNEKEDSISSLARSAPETPVEKTKPPQSYYDAVRSIIVDYIPHLKKCYDEGTSRSKSVIRLKFTIDSIGKASRSEVISDDPSFNDTNDCIKVLIDRIQFPYPNNWKAEMNVPIKFSKTASPR